VTVKTDIVLAGVGGQGVLSVAWVIATAARRIGLHVKQGEVHGMSQRGGAVQAGLRLSDGEISSDLVPRGTADLILSLEPVEALRYLPYLAEGGTVVASIDPVRNIPDYPEIEKVLVRLRALPRVVLVEAERLARTAGSPKSANVVLVGAASGFLPVPPEAIEECIREAFAGKGERLLDANLRAFRAGREAVSCETA
jgi:indolepyruvate ferredoxin oxidoreductase beta subunit